MHWPGLFDSMAVWYALARSFRQHGCLPVGQPCRQATMSALTRLERELSERQSTSLQIKIWLHKCHTMLHGYARASHSCWHQMLPAPALQLYAFPKGGSYSNLPVAGSFNCNFSLALFLSLLPGCRVASDYWTPGCLSLNPSWAIGSDDWEYRYVSAGNALPFWNRGWPYRGANRNRGAPQAQAS